MTPKEELEELRARARMEDLERRASAGTPADQAKAAEIEKVISPAVSIPAQVLSTQPATSHPKGDEAAQADWMVKGDKGDKLVVYEPPVAVARKELLANPNLIKALFPDEEIPPEFIQQMDANSDIYKAYADHKWNDARWAAADSGTTAYRYSKAPWLQGGEAAGLSPLATLGSKLSASVNPLIEGANAFVMGIDDTAAFGAGRRAGEALDRATGNPTEEINEQRIEENPGAHTAGQVAGMFTPGGVMGLLGKGTGALVKGAGGLAAKAGAGAITQGAAKLVGAGVGAAAGGGAMQAGREGVEAATNLGKTGETGTTAGEAAGRVATAALDPMNLGLGVGGEAAGMLAGGIARGVANAPRYGGNIERVEKLGGKVKLGAGPVGTKGTEAATAAGKARDIPAVDVIAEQLAPKIAEAENAVASGNFQAASKAKEDAKVAHGNFKQKYFKSSEGQVGLAPVETMEANLKHLRSKVTRVDGELRPVGNAEGVATARAEFSGDVARVSTKPEPGAIELSPEEAELFLSPALTKGIVPRLQIKRGGPTPKEQPATPAPKGMSADEAWLEEGVHKPKAPSGAGPTPAQSLGPLDETPAPAAPGRGAMRHTDTQRAPPGPEAGHKGQQEAMEMEGLREAKGPMQRDAERMEALAKETGVNSSPLAQAIKSATNEKSGLSSVAGVVKAMGGDRKAAHKALLEAEQRGAIELRPEGALKGRFSPAEEADMIPGPDRGMKLNPIRIIDEKLLGSILLGAGAAAAGSEEGAAGAAAGGLALALKKRGINKVYVVPRRYDAQQHEVRIGQLQDLTKDPKAPGAREAKERYAAALRDRQQRPMDGQPGGWSAKQQEVSDRLKALDETLALAEVEAKKKGTAKRDAPGGTAAKRLVRYSQQKPGELELKKQIETAGAAAGVTPQLNDLRLLEPLSQLRGQMAYRGKKAPMGKSGLIGAAADQFALRVLYPGMKTGSESKTLRGGLLGVRAQQLKKDEKEAR